MNGRACREKGKRWERDLVTRLSVIFGAANVRRGFQFRDGKECPDVVCPGFWVEAKVGRLTNPRAALRQAQRDSAGKGVWPVAICKDDRDPPHVTMDLDDFADLLAEWHALRSR